MAVLSANNLCWCCAERVERDEDGNDSGPLTIRLLFEHQQSDQNEGQQHFYVAHRENRCVSCGDASHYLR